MSGGSRFKSGLGRLKTQLTSLDDQPLGKAALVILLFLDLFVLSAIFNGLSEHMKQLSSPEEFVPSSCREIVIDRRWNPTNRTDNLSQIVVSASGSYYRPEEERNESHPVCTPYVGLIAQIKKDGALTAVFEERSRLGREAAELQGTIDRMKGAYDTSLLETVAKERAVEPRVEALQREFRQKAAALNALKLRIASVDEAIDRDEKVKLLWERLQGLKEEDRRRLIGDLRRLNFWYPVKRLGMQLLFLLPPFVIFYVWNRASIKRGRSVQTLVSAHLLVVASIPAFCKILESVYDVIPKKILKQLIELLVSLKLVAIWHYVLIALAVAVAIFLVYLFQKRLFSRERLIERRISRGDCQRCGKRLPASSQACPFCGFIQFTACPACGKERHVYSQYCRHCGRLGTEA